MTRAARIEAPPVSWSGVLPGLAFVAAWAALYAPVYYGFAHDVWTRDENAHQPFILAIAAGAAWSVMTRSDFSHAATRPSFFCGALILALGLALYAAGLSSDAVVFVSASQVFVAAGAAVALFGFAGASRLWFALALGLYLVVWPGWALDDLTAPLKEFASYAASETLYAAGLPVAHAGAVIAAGQYQLLVADACSGLNSLIALTATAAVYLYAAGRRSFLVNASVIAAAVPIAIAANIARIIVLVLITYYWGYDAGQSFLHEAAGLFMFGAALAGVFLVDVAACVLLERRR
jgi:exosortase